MVFVMVRQPYVFEEVEVPEGVKVDVSGSKVVVKGPLGTWRGTSVIYPSL